MTNEEAIETLKANYPDACFEQLRKAVDMAIEALKKQDVSYIRVGNLISRQAAIDTSLEFFIEFLGGALHENAQKELMARIQRLPSVQPEQKKGKWIRKGEWIWTCSECKRIMYMRTDRTKE